MEITNTEALKFKKVTKQHSANYVSYMSLDGKNQMTYHDMMALFQINPEEAAEVKKKYTREMVTLAPIREPPKNKLAPFSVNIDMIVRILNDKGLRTLEVPLFMPAIGTFTTGMMTRRLAEKTLASLSFFDEKAVILGEGDNTFIELAIPYPDLTKPPRVPTYKVLYPVYGYNKLFLTNMYENILNGRYGGKEETLAAIEIYEKLCTLAEEWAFNAGTPEGQLQRYKEMVKNAMTAAALRKKSFIKTSDLIATIKRWIPARKGIRFPAFDTFDFTSIIKQTIGIPLDPNLPMDGYKEEAFVITLNPDANAGPLWNGTKIEGVQVKKGDTFLSDMLIAQRMMLFLHDDSKTYTSKSYKGFKNKVKDLPSPDGRKTWPDTEKKLDEAIKARQSTDPFLGYQKFTREVQTAGQPDGTTHEVTTYQYRRKVHDSELMEEYWKHYDWTRIFNYFAKSEVYEISKRKEKTRGISARNQSSDIPLQVFLNPVIKHLMNYLEDPNFWNPNTYALEGGTLCGLGTSVYGGTFGAFFIIMKELVHRGPGTATMTLYSDDNATWVAIEGGKILIAEIDMIKAESTVNKQHVIAGCANVRSHYKVFTEGWTRYINYVVPVYVTSAIALIMNQQLPYPLLGSGTPGTSYWNQVQATEFVTTAARVGFERHDKYPFVTPDGKLSPCMEEAHRITGCNVKLEGTYVWDLQWQAEPVRLGYLGFDLLTFRITPDTWEPFSVLRRERLLKTALFLKNYVNESGESKLDAFTTAFLNMARCRALFYLGAWSIPSLHKDVWRSAARSHKVILGLTSKIGALDIQNTMSLVNKMMRELEIEPEWVHGILSAAVQPTMPTLYSLVVLQTNDHGMALEAVRSRIGTMPTTHLITEKEAARHEFDVELEKYPEIDFDEVDDFEKHYPHYDFMLVRLPRHVVLTRQEKHIPVDIEIAPLALRKRANKDVAIPKRVEAYYHKPDLRGLGQYVSKLNKAGRTIYRVPVNDAHLDDLEHATVEVARGASYMVSLLANKFNIPKPFAFRIVNHVSNVAAFVVRPIEDVDEIGFRTLFKENGINLDDNLFNKKILKYGTLPPSQIDKRNENMYKPGPSAVKDYYKTLKSGVSHSKYFFNVKNRVASLHEIFQYLPSDLAQHRAEINAPKDGKDKHS